MVQKTEILKWDSQYSVNISIKFLLNVGTGDLKVNEVSYVHHQIKSLKHLDKENEACRG